jgi:hypothetical protein
MSCVEVLRIVAAITAVSASRVGESSSEGVTPSRSSCDLNCTTYTGSAHWATVVGVSE